MIKKENFNLILLFLFFVLNLVFLSMNFFSLTIFYNISFFAVSDKRLFGKYFHLLIVYFEKKVDRFRRFEAFLKGKFIEEIFFVPSLEELFGESKYLKEIKTLLQQKKIKIATGEINNNTLILLLTFKKLLIYDFLTNFID